MHWFTEKLYRTVGRILLTRKCYISICQSCKRQSDQYFPYHGAFPWEREYWMKFRTGECCGQSMLIKHSFDGNVGALYRLPGYKAHSDARFRNHVRLQYSSDTRFREEVDQALKAK